MEEYDGFSRLEALQMEEDIYFRNEKGIS